MVRGYSQDASATGTVGVPRWPGAIAALVVGALYLLLSDRYAVGPPWLVLVAAAALLTPLTLARLRGAHGVAHVLARALNGVLTLAVAASAALLVVRLSQGQTQALALLRDAALIWGANILTFALWYWNLDGGGPARRHPGRHASTDFAFPQQQQAEDALVEGWSPSFLDYLFVAFNTATAFSPTDTLVLSRRMKLLLMAQSLISLVVVAVLAARAINTIGA
jgi:uncharacterized membrane protein